MTGAPYSNAVRELFSRPDHAGRLDGGRSASATAQGMQVELSARAEDGQVLALRFRAFGCPHLIAAAEAFCRDFEARPVVELLQYRAAEIMQSLAVPVEKTGRILVLEDAVRSLGQTLRETPATKTDH